MLLTLWVVAGCSTTIGGGSLQLPEGDGKHPAIILLHTDYGLSYLEKGYARKLASEGYAAIAVDWHGGTGTNTTDAYDYLISHPGIDASRIGVVGFSRGARGALWFASKLEIMDKQHKAKGIVLYYIGNAIVPWINPLDHPPTLFLHGDQDGIVEPIEIENYCNLQRQNGHICEYKIYKDVTHSFTHYSSYGRYDKNATEDAWNRMIGFFDKHVKN